MAQEERDDLQRSVQRYRFRDVIEPLLETKIVGRAKEISSIASWLEAHSQGCGLVLGLPGMGKRRSQRN